MGSVRTGGAQLHRVRARAANRAGLGITLADVGRPMDHDDDADLARVLDRPARSTSETS
jgi:hypothetical protein